MGSLNSVIGKVFCDGLYEKRKEWRHTYMSPNLETLKCQFFVHEVSSLLGCRG